MPKPSRITAHCSTFLEAKRTPPSRTGLRPRGRVMSIPATMAITAPPIMGKALPRNQLGSAMARQMSIPGPFALIQFILVSSSLFLKVFPVYYQFTKKKNDIS